MSDRAVSYGPEEAMPESGHHSGYGNRQKLGNHVGSVEKAIERALVKLRHGNEAGAVAYLQRALRHNHRAQERVRAERKELDYR